MRTTGGIKIELNIMEIKSIICGAIVLACTLTGSAQTQNTKGHHRSISAHEQAHQRLANVNTKLDITSINEKIQEEIMQRESGREVESEDRQMIGDLLKEARKHIGKPYRHGMKGPKAFDCSGFSSYVYKQFGYKISPASRAQFHEGVKVDRKHLKEGDLVFFSSRSSGSNVGHVGIVISADNATGDFKFIHASIKGVKIDECKGYYANRYIGARRIIE